LLIKEYCLDARENGISDLEAAEEHLRQTPIPVELPRYNSRPDSK
jgi:hypothetical protein